MCTPRNRLAKLASKLDSNTGQYHWSPPLASMINTSGQQHWPRSLVSTSGRHHSPELLATCSKHVDDDEDDNDNDYGDDDNDHDDYGDDGGDGDGDGDDALTIHSNMCVHECARLEKLPS